LGLQAKAEVRPPVQSERRVSPAVRPAFVPRMNATRHRPAEDWIKSLSTVASLGDAAPMRILMGDVRDVAGKERLSLLSTDLFTAAPTPGSSSSPAFATSR
jgi:hypothetical protein